MRQPTWLWRIFWSVLPAATQLMIPHPVSAGFWRRSAASQNLPLPRRIQNIGAFIKCERGAHECVRYFKVKLPEPHPTPKPAWLFMVVIAPESIPVAVKAASAYDE